MSIFPTSSNAFDGKFDYGGVDRLRLKSFPFSWLLRRTRAMTKTKVDYIITSVHIGEDDVVNLQKVVSYL